MTTNDYTEDLSGENASDSPIHNVKNIKEYKSLLYDGYYHQSISRLAESFLVEYAMILPNNSNKHIDNFLEYRASNVGRAWYYGFVMFYKALITRFKPVRSKLPSSHERRIITSLEKYEKVLLGKPEMRQVIKDILERSPQIIGNEMNSFREILEACFIECLSTEKKGGKWTVGSFEGAKTCEAQTDESAIQKKLEAEEPHDQSEPPTYSKNQFSNDNSLTSSYDTDHIVASLSPELTDIDERISTELYKIKHVQVIQPETDNYSDLRQIFKPEHFEFCVSLLRQIKNPVIDSAGRWKAPKRGPNGGISILVAWIDACEKEALTSHESLDRSLLPRLLNAYFPNLNMGEKTQGMFAKHNEIQKKYKIIFQEAIQNRIAQLEN